MARRRAAVGGALVITALIGAVAVWRAKTSDVAHPAASPGPRPGPSHEAPAGDRGIGQRTLPTSPLPLSAAPPALPASATEPTIDLPAPPPPEEGAGDDFKESGLPRELFDAKIRLERLSPSPARLDAAKARLGHEISEKVREELLASFRRHDEAAAAAIGYFRLRQVSEGDAVALIARELDGYRKEAAAALGIPGDQLERILADPAPLRGAP